MLKISHTISDPNSSIECDVLCMQDVFEAGFIPSDTDYRMFSAATGQLGQWPGLDIAHILDSATYHTRQDSLQRLRPGILQVRFLLHTDRQNSRNKH